jgi:hypothetical protein
VLRDSAVGNEGSLHYLIMKLVMNIEREKEEVNVPNKVDGGVKYCL